jgi:TonB family protein
MPILTFHPPGDKMNFFRRLLLITIQLFAVCGLVSAQTEHQAQAAKLETPAYQNLPKAISCPAPPSQGDVSLRIAIDTKGKVSEVKAVSGPENLFPAAQACAKSWEFENPPQAPVTKTVVLRYESLDCPGAESQHGELQYSWGLRNNSNLVVAFIDGEQPAPPEYPAEERKAGKAGTMVLAVSLNSDGTVKESHVLRGLSPLLDKSVMDRLHPLKFKLIQGVSEMNLQNLQFQIVFHATCIVPLVYNSE